MSSDRRSDGVQGLYGMLLGGLIASLVALVVFTVFWGSSVNGSGSVGHTTMVALVGLACAGGLMAAGMVVSDDLPWLAGGFLFASGFTAVWSVGMSFTIEAKWVPITALAIAVAMGMGMGRWKWGRERNVAPPASGDQARSAAASVSLSDPVR